MTGDLSHGDTRAGKFMGHTLPPGTRIGSFEITGLIGEGGFGIVYLAYDASLQRQVALKEYMPSALASRATDSNDISVKSERHAETFSAGLKSFVNEARLLARFDHPSLVKVYQFFEANRTAYMAMPYYEGPTLKRVLAELGQAPDEATLRDWLRPLLNALAVMHQEHCYHRDIAPDNILLTPAGPLLLDFGAARRVIGDMTHALTVVLKPGYAPIEQYGEAASMAQGPWTDLYALASVVYFAVTGHTPTTSVERVMGDELAPLATLARGDYSDNFLAAIDAALSVRPKDRPQDVAAFCALLNQGLDPDSPELFRLSGFQSTGFDALAVPPSRVDRRTTVTARTTALPGNPLSTDAAARDARAPPATIAHATRVPGEAPGGALPDPAARTAPPVPGVAAPPSARPVASARSGARLVAVAGAAIVAAAALAYALGHLTRAPATMPASVPPAATRAPPPPPEPTAAPLTPVPPTSTRTPDAAPAAVPAPPAAALPATPTGALADEPKAAARAAAPPEKPPGNVRSAASKPALPKPTPAATPRADPPPRNAGVNPARCSDILQKASLEPITQEEAAYLRKECR
jgi:serine/threonine protein kinase